MSDGSNWNDAVDKENFNPNDSDLKRFGLCLSYSKSENVAMWMLYSGNDGVMIDYTKKIIKNILEAKYIELGHFEDGKFIMDRKLEKKEFDVKICDILYYGETKNGNKKTQLYVKRSDEINDEFDESLVEELTYSKKTLPWSYENECRIIVTIKKELIPGSSNNVKISFSESSIKELKERIYESPNSRKKNYLPSALRNKMQWDLCKNCDKKKELE